jgi:hypothetical protein
MSGAFPTSRQANVTIKSNQPTVVNRSSSGRYQSRTIAAHLWELTVEFPAMVRSAMMPIFAFAMKQRGRAESFTIIPLNTATPRGIATGTPLANQVGAVGSTSIQIDGWTAGATNILRAGDIFKSSGHTKVYMVTDDCNSQSMDFILLEDSVTDNLLLEDSATDQLYLQDAGAATVLFEPPLITAIADNESITVTNVPFTVMFAGDVQEFKTSAPTLSRYDIDLIEAIS